LRPTNPPQCFGDQDSKETKKIAKVKIKSSLAWSLPKMKAEENKDEENLAEYRLFVSTEFCSDSRWSADAGTMHEQANEF